MRFATWNINSLNVRQERVEQWLADVQPDVVCMQETKLADSAFPQLAFEAMGYSAAHHGEGRWNGVAILSRVGLDDVSFGFADGAEPDAEARLMTARCDGITIVTVYVPNGRSLDADHYQYKLAWLDRLGAHLDAVAPTGAPLIVAGDFNIAPTDDDLYDPAAFVGQTHVSPPERAKLQALLDRGLTDEFRHVHPTRPRCSRGGTTAAATSTRAAGCASTSCWPRRRSSSAPSGASSTATPARASSRATTRR